MPQRFISFFLLLAIVAMGADDQVRSTQEELRRRNVFFGDIDGKPSPEYTEAVKRYQKKKGIAASGQGDHDTLRSLGLLPRSPNEAPPKELDWPAEPVLKSDVHLDPIAEGQELANETGAAPASVGATAPGESRQQAIREHTSASKNPRPQPPQAPEKRSRYQAAPLSFRDPVALPAELSKFLNTYLRAVGRELLKDELQFYADHVDYFGRPQVDRRIVERSLRNYYLRWPKRSYSLAGAPAYTLLPARGEIVVTYRLNFVLENKKTRVKGQTENHITLNAATADPRIVSISEQRVRQ